MNVNELKALLIELAEKDLSDDSKLEDHPCCVAIRAIESYKSDADFLREIALGRKIKTSKRAEILLKMGCNNNF